MGVVDLTKQAPGAVKTSSYHVRCKLHVFHPGTGAHAGTLQLDKRWEGVTAEDGINSSPVRGTDYECTWKWVGSPYGTTNSTFHISPVASLDLYKPESGHVRQTMRLLNGRWPERMLPVHPWFQLADKIGLKDPNFVSAPQRPRNIVRPEDPVAITWICKLLEEKYDGSPGSGIP